MVSHLRVLRHPDFRNLFLGQAASAVGDQVVIVALALYITAAHRLGDRPGARAGRPDAAARRAAPVRRRVGRPPAAPSDHDRPPTSARAALHAMLAVLILAGGASIAEMVVIEALFGAGRAFFQPAYSGLVPQTIARGADPGGPGAVGVQREPGDPRRPRAGHGARARARRRRGVRARRRHLPGQRRAAGRVTPRHPGRGRGGDHERLARTARRLARGALAAVGVGDDRRLHRRGAVRLRAVVRAGADHRPGPLRRRGRVRRARERGRGRRRDRLAGRPALAPERGRCWSGCCWCSSGRCRTACSRSARRVAS